MELFKTIYEVKKKGEIRICDSSFGKKNKRKIRLVIDNKIFQFRDKYKINNDTITNLKVKFIILNKQKLSLKSMFNGCSSIKEFHSKVIKELPVSKVNLYTNKNNNVLSNNNFKDNKQLLYYNLYIPVNLNYF